jgi:replicative DNA helicase
MPIDIISVPAELVKRTESSPREMLDQYIAELLVEVPGGANWDLYLAIVRDKYKARTVILECERVIRLARSVGCGAEELEGLLEEVETTFFRLRDDKKLDADLKDARAVMNEVVDAAELVHNHRSRTIGISTGFFDVDRMLGGFMNSELYLIAARPSQGKSAFMVNMIKFQLMGGEKQSPVAVGLFSLEMPAVDQGKRMVSDHASVDCQRFRDGFFGQKDLERIGVAASALMGTRLFIDDTPSLSIQQFRAKARRMVSKHGVQIIYIDYLQLMRSSSKRAQENRQAEVAEISSLLKRTARELKIPVVALAQLTRDAENKKPNLSQLRESGQLEQDADVVVFIFRPEKGKCDEDGKVIEVENASAIVAKQRNGPTGESPLKFYSQFTRFVSTTEKAYSNDKSKRQQNRP